MFSLKNNFKTKNGVQKILLRMATKNIISKETNKRIKNWMEFSSSYLVCRKENNILEDIFYNNTITSQNLLIKIKKIINEHKKIIKNNKIKNHMMFL